MFFEEYSNLLLSTNTGSLFYLNSKKNSLFIFASERFILKKIIASKIIGNNILESDIKQLSAFEAINLNLENISTKERLEMRQRVINCSIDDLIRVSEKYLTRPSKKSILAGKAYAKEAASLGLNLKEV